VDPRASEEDLACRGISRPAKATAQVLTLSTGEPADQRSVTAPAAARSTPRRAEGDASDLVSALARTFARAVQREMEPSLLGEPADLAELRGAVQAYVARLKAVGAPPESVVVAVKAATASGALLAWQSHDTRREAAALTERVVRWSVQAYYAGGAS
jgi:hypothetical protein